MESHRPEVAAGSAPGKLGVTIERYVAPKARAEDVELEVAKPGIRPTHFAEYIGQDKVKENLRTYVDAARRERRQLDHVILHGPPGLGKTTLARIVASALGATLYETRGPSIERPGDLVGILLGMQPGAVLFIDEIHRLPIKVEETLYSAMEDQKVDIIMGERASARVDCLDVPPFTLVGATTRLSLLSKPLLTRFGIHERLDHYDVDALCQIVERSAGILGIRVSTEGAREIGRRARGTPRIANRLLKRTWDFAVGSDQAIIDAAFAGRVLERQGIDPKGLDRLDRLILRTVAEQYNGGPVGIEALAATLNEDRSTLEEVYEPFLVHGGYLARGSRGRFLTDLGRRHLTDAQP